MKTPVVIVAIAALAIVASLAYGEKGMALAAATLIGGVAGFGLYHASFGFTGAWRRIVRERRGAGLRAQMLLIALTCLVSFPLIAWGTGDFAARGFILPMGVASAFGAFVFGAGMQLGGGCASGTLFTTGGGSTRMVVVLAFFVTGSVIATAHWEFWTRPAAEGSGPAYEALKDIVTYRLNNNRGISLIKELGPMGALALMSFVLALITWVSVIIERRTHGGLEVTRSTGSIPFGPWSLTLGAITLALVSIGSFLVLGRPWGVTSAFALWGAKIYTSLGGDVSEWIYWAGWRSGQLKASVFANSTSVMNFGIVFGAMAAAAMAGKFAPKLQMTRRELLTAVIGGLMMGYGARLAYGCNIGAYLGGLVSGSLHGWWWLIWGFAGSFLGVRMRAFLSMDPPILLKSKEA
ncbi:MAG: YeeE/YedE family protein [Pikeienuella sp.]